jgi:hypothetical protein
MAETGSVQAIVPTTAPSFLISKSLLNWEYIGSFVGHFWRKFGDVGIPSVCRNPQG